MAQFFQVFGAEGAVDHAVIAAHGERHAMAHNDLVAIIHYGDLRDPANGTPDERIGSLLRAQNSERKQ